MELTVIKTQKKSIKAFLTICTNKTDEKLNKGITDLKLLSVSEAKMLGKKKLNARFHMCRNISI